MEGVNCGFSDTCRTCPWFCNDYLRNCFSASFAAITESFIDLPSIIITIGGTISCLITSYTFKDLITYLKGAGIAFKDPKLDHGAVISKIIELSNVARKEGLLALEEVASNLEDEFMKKVFF